MKTSFHIDATSVCIEHGRRNIPFEQITHLEGNINYTIIHMIDGRKIMTAFTLKKFQDITSNGFVRTHKSFIINLSYIQSYHFIEKTLILVGDKKVTISRRKNKELKTTLEATAAS